ncbi:MAG: hypothetical protein IJG16_09825, partial [Clostridia bacterium]|nr:hypothetical protein [Clostridia bacterium]
VEIATFDFYLKDASLADMLTVDTFSIEPWQDIKAARDWAAAGKAANSSFDPKFWEYWRVCDSDNVRSNLKEGRIDATKSVVNGVETNGFFQAAVNGAIGDDNPSSFYDVMTDLRYGFQIKNSVIRFHVTDLYSGDEVEDAKIKLFDDTATKLLQSKNTSYTGRANFTVNTANKSDPKFAYEVTKPGYWPVPVTLLDRDRPFVKTTTGKATEVEVELDKRVFHLPVVAPENNAQLSIIGAADLGGEKYAYNGRDYHFRIKGAKGYRITKYPNWAYVSIGDDNAGDTKVVRYAIQPDKYGVFTVPAELLNQDSLTKEYMDKLAAGDAENNIAPDPYYENAKEQPEDDGYRSYNVVVQFDQFEVLELDYIVEGMTGAHGQVSYNKATKDYTDGLMPIEPSAYVEDTLDTYIKVKTQKSVKDPLDPDTTVTPADHKTGTFTFKADDGYMVERVYINGLQTDIYDDLTTFSYTFGVVDMDCSIIVMFWDGKTPSTDTILTLVVGDYGFADVTSPVEETGENALMCTRRTYLNPTQKLEFTTRAFSEGHELYMVEKEIEGEKRVDITERNDGGKYSISPVEAKNVITYVTFKNKLAEITPSLFVKSYVHSGQGVADPAGILIYNIYDSVEIDLIADSENAWLARGVMISPYEDLDDTSEFEFEEKLPENTYRYESLTDSIAIGSVFMEKAYPIDGYIDLGQKSDVTKGAPLRGAVVKFVRLDKLSDGTYVERAKQVPFMTDSSNLNRRNSKFETELPAGMWNVYVMKQGYVTYKITNFKMIVPDRDTDVRHFGHNGSVQQVVVPLIGSTRSGESVTLEDAADVKSGMRGNVTSAVKEMTDVDNNNSVDYVDLAYVWKNYNKFMFEQEYSDFAANGSKDIVAMTTPEAP